MAKIKAVFWDVDNTLINSSVVFGLATREAVSAMFTAGLPVPDIEDGLRRLRTLDAYFNPTWYPSLLVLLCKECGVEEQKQVEQLVSKGARAFDKEMAQIRALPHVMETLRELKTSGMRMGVISNALMKMQLPRLAKAGLLEYLDPDLLLISSSAIPHDLVCGGFSGEFVGLSPYMDGSSLYRVEKPWPAMLDVAVKRTGLSPREMLFVGDLVTDVLAANIAGFISVMLRTPGGLTEETPDSLLRLEQPDYFISSILDVVEIVRTQ